VIHFVGLFAGIALALLFAAGTLRWVAGWCFLILNIGFGITIFLWFIKHGPSLLKERMTGLKKSNREAWDKVLMMLWFILSIIWLVLMPLDAVRLRWSHMPVWLQVAGGLFLIVFFCLIYLVFKENPYLSPAVRIQKERGQTVISTGPCRHVRHPLYAAFIPFFIGTALLLGSLVRNSLRAGAHRPDRNQSRVGRTYAAKGAARLRRLHDAIEVSIHTICLVTAKASKIGYDLNS